MSTIISPGPKCCPESDSQQKSAEGVCAHVNTQQTLTDHRPCTGNWARCRSGKQKESEVIRARLAESSKTNKRSFWVPLLSLPQTKPQSHTVEFCQFSRGHKGPGGMKFREHWVRCMMLPCQGAQESCFQATEQKQSQLNTFFTAIEG